MLGRGRKEMISLPAGTFIFLINDSVCIAGHSWKVRQTNGIIIEAKMRAGRRRKLLQQKAGLARNCTCGVSVISMTSAKTFADEKQIY
jgi:hypothetical protein